MSDGTASLEVLRIIANDEFKPSLVIDDSPPKDDGRSQEELAAIGREWLDAQALQSPPPNPSGITPTENYVLVLPNKVEDKTAGGVLLPEETAEKKKFATNEGVIIAAAHLAFNYATEIEWDGHKPKAGQRVVFAKYAGFLRKGKDGVEYRLLSDKDIVATVED